MKRCLVRLRRFWRWWGKPAYLTRGANIFIALVALLLGISVFSSITWRRVTRPDPHSVEIERWIWDPPQPTSIATFHVDWWAVVGRVVVYIVFVVVVFLFCRAGVRQKRLGKGLCPRCAYDLRNLMSNRCPECGEHLSPRDRTVREIR